MYNGATFDRLSQARTAEQTNSGPLSQRTCAGTPRSAINAFNTDTTSAPVMRRCASIIRHSRVNSSITLKTLMPLPSAVRS